MALFLRPKPVIGMLHLPPLPGSPRGALALDAVREWVLRDAEALAEGGVDALILENFGDAPFYPGRVPPHTVAQMTALAQDVARRFPLPLGINVLRNDGCAALAVAAAAGAGFIRVNVFSGARLTDQGVIQAEPHLVLRDRRLLGAQVLILADVAVKHSAPLAPRNLEDEIEDTLRRAGADAVIVTGAATGKAGSLDELRCARKAAAGAPVLAGSGVAAATIAETLGIADGAIVGSALKRDGVAANPVDVARVRALMEAAAEARG